MLGNCAIGRLRMLMTPTITITMEITMATMGRLMKNFDIGLLPLCLCGKSLGIYLHSPAYLLHSLGDHAIAALQSIGYNPVRVHAIAHGNRADAHLVVATHNCHLITALKFGYRALRNQQRILLGSHRRANFSVAAGTQNISRIWK